MLLIVNIVIENLSAFDTVRMTGNLNNLTVVNKTVNNGVGDNSTADITAAATNLPAGYKLVICDGDTVLATGDNKSVHYVEKELKESKTCTVKVLDANNVQVQNSTNTLTKNIKVTVKTGFFRLITAFFRSLFKTLPAAYIKP